MVLRIQVWSFVLAGVGLTLLLGCQRQAEAAAPLEARPESLEVYIERVQRQHVRLSLGPYAFECFTDDDLRRFAQSGVQKGIAEAASNSAEFHAIVASIGKLPAPERDKILTAAHRHFHPTWAQQGQITTDGSGQTWAGQRAERLIVETIMSVVSDLLRDQGLGLDGGRPDSARPAPNGGGRGVI